MAFDLSSAKPAGFDVGSASAVSGGESDAEEQKRREREARRGIFGGIPEAAVSLGSSALAGPVSGVAGIAGTMLPGPSGQGADWVQKVQEAMTVAPESKGGKMIVNAVSAPFEKLAEGADVVGGGVTDVTGSPALGAASNTLVQSLPLLLGKVGKGVLPKGELPGTEAARKAALVANLQRDTAALSAKDAGYSLPPSQVDPGTFSFAEGIGGKTKTAQKLSVDNQLLSQDKIRSDFNLAKDQPLSPETFDKIRAAAGEKYQAVRDTGSSPISAQYVADLNTLDAPLRKMAEAYPNDPPPPILAKTQALMEPTFNADAAVSKIRDLRNEARKAASGQNADKNYAGQLRYLADTVEEELQRHLERTGQPQNMIDNFQDARKTIAKSYTAEKYVNPVGEVNAPAMAAELKKKTPLEGGMKEIAAFGGQFPKAAQLPSRIGGTPAFEPIDAAVAMISPHTKFAIGNLFGRSLARGLVGSDFYQKHFVNPPSYGPSLGARFMESLQNEPAALAGESIGDRARRKRLAELLGSQ